MCKLPYARLQECKIARNEFMMIKEQCPAITGKYSETGGSNCEITGWYWKINIEYFY